MSKRIECAKCGEPNELSGMFCRNCGAKLDFAAVQADGFEKQRKKDKSSGAGKKIFGFINLVIFLALVASLVLMCWPTAPLAEVGSEQLGKEAKDKLLRLHEACEDGIQMQTLVAEQEVNAYLAMVLKGHHREGGSPPVDVEDLNIMISKGGVEVFTAMKLGPASITYLIEGTPRVGPGGFAFDVEKVTAGHMPMPGPLGNWVAGKVANVFSELEPEKFVLDRLVEMNLAERRAQVTTPGK